MVVIDIINDINDPYAKLCFTDIVKGINVGVFNLISRTNETEYIGWHETYWCKCRLNASVCNDKQRWNKYNSRCECNYDCKCDKSRDVGEYVDYKYRKCRSKLVDKLV